MMGDNTIRNNQRRSFMNPHERARTQGLRSFQVE